MAEILRKERVEIVHAERTEGSSFALPGSGATPVYLGTDYWVEVVVLDGFETYAAITSGNVYANHILVGSSYTVGAWMSASTWTWTYSSGKPVAGSGAIEVASATIGVTANTGTNGDSTHGYFDWGFPIIDTSSLVEGGDTTPEALTNLGFHDMGQLSGFEGDGSGTAYIYISGIGTYSVTNPIYPTPARIAIPRVRQVIELDYYPWARLDDDAWSSYNNSDRSLTRLPDTALTNLASDASQSHVLYLDGGSWQIMPKLG